MNSEDIKKLRLSLNLTQENFAHMIGVTSGTFNRWENGKAKPSRLAIDKMTTIMKQKKVSL